MLRVLFKLKYKMEFEFKEWKIEDLITLYTEGKLDLNPPYQRGDIWTLLAKKRLIDTMKIGFPLPAFFLHLKDENNFEMVGIVYIKATFNNTIAHLTDLAGSTITIVSGGEVTKQSRLKANPTIAMFVAKKIAEKAKELGIRQVFVRVRGKGGKLAPSPGPGANAAIKSLEREGIKILNITDVTPVPRGGPKVKGGKRGRRV